MNKLLPCLACCLFAACSSAPMPPWSSSPGQNAASAALVPTSTPTSALMQPVAVEDNVFEPSIPGQAVRNAVNHGGELSYEVEKIARQDACNAKEPATLLSSRPGVAFYRVGCTDGRQVLLKCEMRQCFIGE